MRYLGLDSPARAAPVRPSHTELVVEERPVSLIRNVSSGPSRHSNIGWSRDYQHESV